MVGIKNFETVYELDGKSVWICWPERCRRRGIESDRLVNVVITDERLLFQHRSYFGYLNGWIMMYFAYDLYDGGKLSLLGLNVEGPCVAKERA